MAMFDTYAEWWSYLVETNPFWIYRISSSLASDLPWEDASSSSSSSSSSRGGVLKGGLKRPTSKASSYFSITGPSEDTRRVTFSTTAQCVLIPSRSDIVAQGLQELLWFPDSVFAASRAEAEQELKMTLSSNASSLSLYAAMSLLYRPCSSVSPDRMDHFRMLIIDDSMVARKMFTMTLVRGHKAAGTKENLYVHQASTYESACDFLSTKSFNLVAVDMMLTQQGGDQSGADIIRMIRAKYDSCVIVGISSLIGEGNTPSTQSACRQAFLDAGADLVWKKPIPHDAWSQLVSCMPIEF